MDTIVATLKILKQYASESYYGDNQLTIKLLDTEIFFVVVIDFLDDNINEEDFDIESDIDLEYFLDNYDLLNGAVIHSIVIQIAMHQNNIAYLNAVVQGYYSHFNAIPPLEFGSNDSGWCPYYDMFYQIPIPVDAIESQLIDTFSVRQNTISQLKFLDKYYSLLNWYGWQDIREHVNVRLDELKTISAQTKVRRVAYIKMILGMFNKSSYYPDNIFQKKVEFEANHHESDLLHYANNKGKIGITKNGNSSKPYIEAAIAMQLLYFQNNAYKISKFGKILLVLENQLSISMNNYFELSKLQKAFFLFFILKTDGFYLWILLDLINLQSGKTTLKNLKREFQAYTLSQLKFVLKNSDLSTTSKNEIVAKIKRIKEWKKPESYLEHIIEPRINWLFDLNIIDSNDYAKNLITLSSQGMTLLNCFSSYTDIFLEKYTILGQFRCEDYFDLINEIYDVKANQVGEEDIELMEQYILESFFLFKTMAPNRVTASQAMLYTCFMMLFKEKKIINFCTLGQYLNSKKNTKFIFEWYKTEQDGSIRRKK